MDQGRVKNEELERICRQQGLPLTVQRRAVLQALAVRVDHPSADQILEDVLKKLPEISRTTVYRVLETLVRLNIIRKVCHLGPSVRYDANTGRHPHFVCLNCDKIADLPSPSLDRLPFPEVSSGFRIEDYSIEFSGLCSNCAGKLSSRRHGQSRMSGKLNAKQEL
jgi:Fur family peroxide stress response transcriptional regulator